MPNTTDVSEIAVQLAVLTQEIRQQRDELKAYALAQEKLNSDFEKRLRDLETKSGLINTELATIRERMTIAQMLQAALSTLAAAVVYLIK